MYERAHCATTLRKKTVPLLCLCVYQYQNHLLYLSSGDSGNAPLAGTCDMLNPTPNTSDFRKAQVLVIKTTSTISYVSKLHSSCYVQSDSIHGIHSPRIQKRVFFRFVVFGNHHHVPDYQVRKLITRFSRLRR